MNCPVRTDPLPDDGHNQNPPSMPAELTTRRSMNPRREGGADESGIHLDDGSHGVMEEKPGVIGASETEVGGAGGAGRLWGRGGSRGGGWKNGGIGGIGEKKWWKKVVLGALKAREMFVKYLKFMGPGFMVAVAYIDPGNYATDVAAGASYRFKLLFVILLSNLFAILLQSLCAKLGTVTGMNLAENCKAHLPRWLNYTTYAFAEAAIIATDIAEVIGTAIALNILLKIPLVAGCAISIVDVFVILFFYNHSGMSMRALRAFEIFVALLVLGVVVCFCYELSKLEDTTVGEVFRGYLPSPAIVESKGLYQSCGILGATVMPHSLYLGSGIVQNRLRHFDARRTVQERNVTGTESSHGECRGMDSRQTHGESAGSGENALPDNASATSISTSSSRKYRPSLAAIKACLNYSILELSFCLFTFALFVNSAILIVAGASLSRLPPEETDTADLFSIHALLAQNIAPIAGTIFALALLLSGTSAGIVCTISGQMVAEGQLNWHMRPWLRRLVTRGISILPSIVIAGAVGRKGLSTALEASQVALSVVLPFVSAPLIWFTFNTKVMSVVVEDDLDDEALGARRRGIESGEVGSERQVTMRISIWTAIAALVVWLVVVVMNVALLVLVGLGVD